MEKFTCNLIVTGIIPEVNINRTLRVINLKAHKDSIDTLDQWGSNVKKLTDILNQVFFIGSLVKGGRGEKLSITGLHSPFSKFT